jgi:PPE-repeat protein
MLTGKLFVSAHQNSINTSINNLGTSISIHEINTINNEFIISMFFVFHKPCSVNKNNCNYLTLQNVSQGLRLMGMKL